MRDADGARRGITGRDYGREYPGRGRGRHELGRHEAAGRSRQESTGSGPAAPGTAIPGTARPDFTRSDTAWPGPSRSDTARSDTARPDAARPGTGRPDAVFARHEAGRQDTGYQAARYEAPAVHDTAGYGYESAGHGTAGAADGPGAATPAAAAEYGEPAAPARPEIPYGEWPSPITAAQVAAAGLRLGFPTAAADGSVWWQEVRPDEHGRSTIIFAPAGGQPHILLPAPWNTRTRVHEYGGKGYLPVPREDGGYDLLFSNFGDSRLYLAGPGVAQGQEQPRPLTPDPEQVPSASGTGVLRPNALRFADFTVSPDGREIWCVHERHDEGAITRSIVAVPLDGSAAGDAGAIRTLVSGTDFLAYPTPSPDGKWLAWICWNHPHMPWDGTELRVAPVEDGVAGRSRLVKGSIRESVLCPAWRDATSLYAITDWTGWWNIYQLGLSGVPPQALYPADEEFAGALWQLGPRPYAVLGDGRLAVTHGQGTARLGILDPETCELTDLDIALTDVQHSVAAAGTTIAIVGGSPTRPDAVLRIDTATGQTEVLRESSDTATEEAYLPAPRAVELEGVYGRVVHALVYPPSSPDAVGPAGELPPYVVWVHGGPTDNVTAQYDLEKAYFTSRGIGVIDVNYGGSTGYGRSYRERLRRQWGVVDVEDAMSAARSLARASEADPKRLAIRGGSAGGWTALAAVTTGVRASGPVFSAATSYYGVADLSGFVEQTHDFESRYIDGLIGPLPGFATVYTERAPIGHVTDATAPVLLLQGLDDPVVPPVQAESIAADLAAHGIRYSLITFEGEAHGFRKTDTVVRSLEAELSFYGQILGFQPPGITPVRVEGGPAAD